MEGNPQKAEILITGATGNVGKGAIDYLLSNNSSFIAAIPDFPGEKEKLPQNVPHRVFDFANSNTYESTLKGITKIFLMRPPPITDIKELMLPFLKKAKQLNVKYIVVLSLMGVNPVVPHWKMEKYVKKLGFSYTFIRPSFFMQNLTTTHGSVIRDSHDLLIPAGKAKTSFIDARDIGEVAGKLLNNELPEYKNRSIVLTGPEALDYFQVAQIMTDVLGEKFTYSNPKAKKFKKIMRKYGFQEEYVKVMSMLYKITKMGSARKVTSTLKMILGHEPINLRKFVEDYRDIWKK